MNSFAWIVILLCTPNFLTTLAHQNSEMLRSKDILISSHELAFANMEEKHEYGRRRKLTAAEEIALTGKGQKGKGAYGGANVVHRRPGDKNAAASYSYRPWFFVLCAAILGFSFFS
ncbi:uncharacterized protein LOC131005043 [Salvia miltiorrhiza]|uniref:uncharacterized protein LOC131005043 n=1 Tax=Salvia miltiorrhiza TaxID=226208 RepID=UPI0025AD6A19|nr:uncharacterized protein LOC131005043 [Salvia miltiorrhiza]